VLGTILLDAVRVLIAASVAVYAFLTYAKLKGGRMAKPYGVFTLCGLVGTSSAVADLLGADMAHDMLGIVFYSLLLAGFIYLYRVWNTLGK
jgi:hypothetical protein